MIMLKTWLSAKLTDFYMSGHMHQNLLAIFYFLNIVKKTTTS